MTKTKLTKQRESFTTQFGKAIREVKLTKRETVEDKALNNVCEVLTKEGPRMMAKLDKTKQENVSAVVGLLVVAIVFIIGINIGLFVANFLK